ncbi:MAG: ATP phosphoribosyltransferase [Planctomycetota bacterium]
MTATSETSTTNSLRVALPKGRMLEGLKQLLLEAGLPIAVDYRNYRVQLGDRPWTTKLLKPQNVVEMLHAGSRDLGFAGADWVAELDADVVELVDTRLDPVTVVVAEPRSGVASDGPLVVASEYERLTRRWMEKQKLSARFVRSYGSTEVFPPEDADMIVDNTATGATLRANGLRIRDEILRSSTRLYANPCALEDPEKRRAIDDFRLLVESVLSARSRSMVELNVSADDLERVAAALPCLREVTVAPLYREGGFAIKAAIPRDTLPDVLPRVRDLGGRDIIVTRIDQLVG